MKYVQYDRVGNSRPIIGSAKHADPSRSKCRQYATSSPSITRAPEYVYKLRFPDPVDSDCTRLTRPSPSGPACWVSGANAPRSQPPGFQTMRGGLTIRTAAAAPPAYFAVTIA